MPVLLFYFTLGVLAVFLLDRTLRAYTRMPVEEVKKKGFWTAGIGMVLASLLSPALRRLAVLALLVAPWRWGRGGGGSLPGRLQARMSRQEAREVLGVGEHADREEIEASYRRLMRVNHPDQGGSEYFAKKLNEARDVLLKGKS